MIRPPTCPGNRNRYKWDKLQEGLVVMIYPFYMGAHT